MVFDFVNNIIGEIIAIKMISGKRTNIAIIVLLIFFIILFIPCEIHKAYNQNKEISNKISFFKPVIDSLIARGVDSSFVFTLVSHKDTKFNEKYVKINVTGYLKKPDYSSNYNRRSVRKCRKFYKAHKKLLKDAEQQYGVPARIITSILWIETKFGKYTGKHHLPSVYFSTALASRYEFIQMNLRELKKHNIRDSVLLDSLTKKIIQRAEKKSNWALEQIVHLDTADKQLPGTVNEMRGSWAGAFGLCQFIPSSYVRWAVDGDADGKVDLFNLNDAVHSIANYLKSNGWTNKYNDKRAALHHYNNSTQYVNAVLILASRI